MAAKKNQPKSKPIPKVKLSKPLGQLNRKQLNDIAKKANVDSSVHKNIKSLVDALKPLTKYTPAKPKAAKRAAPKPKTGAKGRKVNWDKAFIWYIEDHTRSYADVAKQFGVVKKTVEQAAKYTYTEGPQKGTWCTWAERRQELGEIARKKAEEDYKKTAPARSQQHLLQYRNLQIAASQKVTSLAQEGKWLIDPDTKKKIKIQSIDARQLADVAKALKLSIDGERVIMGLPTSVSTIKPGADDDTGKGWGELLALSMERVAQENNKK